MQTFLPYIDFKKSAKCLDRQRLGKQRVECKQINIALDQGPLILYKNKTANEKGLYIYGEIPEIVPKNHSVRKTPWYNHPATKMWKNYQATHALYAMIICKEWRSRGYNDSVLSYFQNHYPLVEMYPEKISIPSWLTNKFCIAHRSNLLRKNETYYRQFWPKLRSDLEYVWPTN